MERGRVWWDQGLEVEQKERDSEFRAEVQPFQELGLKTHSGF